MTASATFDEVRKHTGVGTALTALPLQPAALSLLGAVLLLGLACVDVSEAAALDPAATIHASCDAFWTVARGRPFQEQIALWDKLIEQTRQDLYAAIVWEPRDYPDWRERKVRLLKQRFLEYPGVSAQIAPSARALQANGSGQAVQFRRLFPDASTHPRVRWVLAPNFDAKSGVLGSGTAVLVFAVDTILIEHADPTVIVPHELFHLYHANHAGINNDGFMSDADLTLPLFTEGLATYVRSVLSPGHSDGELLLQSDLGAIDPARLPVVAARFLVDCDTQASDTDNGNAFRRWFNGSNKSYQPDLTNRTGYWWGLKVVRQLHNHYFPRELASWPPAMA